MKGLVVEKHTDRVILSTENGEVPVMLKDVRDIQYEDPAQDLYELGRAREADEKLGEALAYYEKAVEVNPDFEEAKKAALAVKNRFWATLTEGPTGEVEKQQAIHDRWRAGTAAAPNGAAQAARPLRESIGLTLEKRGDWVRLSFVDPKMDAGLVGLKKGDRLLAIDGTSLRYLGLETVTTMFTSPRFTNFTLEIERDLHAEKRPGGRDFAALGMRVKLEYQGLVVHSVKSDGFAERAGVREGDLLTFIGGEATRYMPLRKAERFVQKAAGGRVALTIRRSALLMRK